MQVSFIGRRELVILTLLGFGYGLYLLARASPALLTDLMQIIQTQNSSVPTNITTGIYGEVDQDLFDEEAEQNPIVIVFKQYSFEKFLSASGYVWEGRSSLSNFSQEYDESMIVDQYEYSIVPVSADGSYLKELLEGAYVTCLVDSSSVIQSCRAVRLTFGDRFRMSYEIKDDGINVDCGDERCNTMPNFYVEETRAKYLTESKLGPLKEKYLDERFGYRDTETKTSSEVGFTEQYKPIWKDINLDGEPDELQIAVELIVNKAKVYKVSGWVMSQYPSEEQITAVSSIVGSLPIGRTVLTLAYPRSFFVPNTKEHRLVLDYLSIALEKSPDEIITSDFPALVIDQAGGPVSDTNLQTTSKNGMTITIITPEKDQTFRLGEFIYFEATVMNTIGSIDDGTFEWSSDKDGIIGTGKKFNINARELSTGKHTITFTANTNSHGKGQLETTIEVQ